ncbi:MAG: GGDEF domain-containing protein [Lachnospiraceae bacterium]|nr:GGDEF domain-containing protein [Lachnospiraceae bacterium]
MNLKNIAVLMTALDSDAQAEILKGIEAYGKENGCNIAVFLWFTGVYEKEKHNLGEVNIAMLPDLNLFDGVILLADIFHMAKNRSLLGEMLGEVSSPIVTIGCKYGQAPSIRADSYAGMRGLLEYLVLERGLRRLHFVKGVEGNADAEARFQAYVDVLTEHEIPIEPERISAGDFYVTGGESAAKEILSSTLPFPEAIVCANDTMAITVCDILTEKGYRVPEDVVITGYDYSMEGRLHYPRILSVRINGQELGERACRKIFSLMEGKAVEEDFMVPDEVVLEDESVWDTLMKGKDPKSEGFINITDITYRKMAHHINSFEKWVMEAEGFNGWLEAVKNFIEQIGPTEFYCCTNREFVFNTFEATMVEQEDMSTEERLAYSKKVDVLLAYKNGQFFEKSSFESRYAFDELFTETNGGKLYIFSPMHYLDRNFGYFVFVDSRFPIVNPLYVSWLIYMGHAIENIRKQSMLKNAMTRLDEMYIKDSLTGVYNRFGMERFFIELKRKCLETRVLMQLSFVDVDGLKKINDVYGHEDGDRIICAIAEILHRESDRYCVVRYGGDEFVVMGSVRSEVEVMEYWNRVQTAIERYNELHKNQAMLAASFGFTVVELDLSTDLEDCLREADKKMYTEKNRRKALLDK